MPEEKKAQIIYEFDNKLLKEVVDLVEGKAKKLNFKRKLKNNTNLSFNRGKIWGRNDIKTIKWKVIAPSGEGTKPYPFWPKTLIDLFKRVAYLRHP